MEPNDLAAWLAAIESKVEDLASRRLVWLAELRDVQAEVAKLRHEMRLLTKPRAS